MHAFSRLELLVGKKGLVKLSESRIAVFGIGGVGSFAAEALIRSGIGRFVLVDHDSICLTNLNRQIHATMKTIGRPKVEVMRERMLEINPQAEIDARRLFYTPETGGEIMDGDFDYIIDAVDNVTAKLDIAVRAKARGIPIISSMGTGNKFDPSRLRITDISRTHTDPLAKVMRKELRIRGITALKVLFSDEKPAKTIDAAQTGCGDCRMCPEAGKSHPVRRSTPGSVSFVPPAAGMIIAGEAVRDILGIGSDT